MQCDYLGQTPDGDVSPLEITKPKVREGLPGLRKTFIIPADSWQGIKVQTEAELLDWELGLKFDGVFDKEGGEEDDHGHEEEGSEASPEDIDISRLRVYFSKKGLSPAFSYTNNFD